MQGPSTFHCLVHLGLAEAGGAGLVLDAADFCLKRTVCAMGGLRGGVKRSSTGWRGRWYQAKCAHSGFGLIAGFKARYRRLFNPVLGGCYIRRVAGARRPPPYKANSAVSLTKLNHIVI